MSAPGWYPDPAGSGQVRYFDGAAWTQDVRPAAATGGPPATPPGGRPRRGWVVVAVVVVVLALALMIWRPWSSLVPIVAEDTNSSVPSVSGWDETSRPSDPPTPSRSGPPTDGGGRPVACPYAPPGHEDRRGNRYYSGGLSYEGVAGWNDSGGFALDFGTDRSGQTDPVTGSWVAATAIATLDMNDFPYPEQAATQVSDCMSTSYYYTDLDRREILDSRAYDVGGRPGWLVRVNFWNKPNTAHGVPGDEVVILVVDTGRPDSLAIFHTEAPIGDARRLALVQKSLDSVALE